MEAEMSVIRNHKSVFRPNGVFLEIIGLYKHDALVESRANALTIGLDKWLLKMLFWQSCYRNGLGRFLHASGRGAAQTQLPMYSIVFHFLKF